MHKHLYTYNSLNSDSKVRFFCFVCGWEFCHQFYMLNNKLPNPKEKRKDKTIFFSGPINTFSVISLGME